MSDAAVTGACVLGFVSLVMVLVYGLSRRGTRDAINGDVRPQDPARRRLGLFYVDPTDSRVWVPRPQGNGWDPNLATTGGRLVIATLVALPLLVVVVALLTS